MTQEELIRYNKLSQEEKETYDFYAKRNPGWNQSKIITMIGLSDVFRRHVDGGGGDVNVEEPETQKYLFGELGKWIYNNHRDIYVKVAPFIQNVINKLTYLIAQGVKVVKNIFELFKELFT